MFSDFYDKAYNKDKKSVKNDNISDEKSGMKRQKSYWSDNGLLVILVYCGSNEFELIRHNLSNFP